MVEIPQHDRKIDLDRQIRERLRRQNGFVTRQQLLALGLPAKAVDWRVTSGRYVAVYHGVYAEGVAREDPVGRASAGVLACGPDAALSHGSAASLWGFAERWTFPLEVTTKGKRTRPGILTHRCRLLTPRDITRHWAIPVTTPARTVLDVAPRLTTRQLTRLVNDALRTRDLRPAALQDVLQRNRYHPGAKLLTPFAENQSNPTNSDFEDEFLAFTAKYGLPTPQINVKINGRQADAYFPEHHLIVECDGWEFHKDRAAFEDDRERDAENLRHGTPTVRVTKRRLRTHLTARPSDCTRSSNAARRSRRRPARRGRRAGWWPAARGPSRGRRR